MTLNLRDQYLADASGMLGELIEVIGEAYDNLVEPRDDIHRIARVGLVAVHWDSGEPPEVQIVLIPNTMEGGPLHG